ncbi:MAG: branched-chain amino acid ABC transporter permease [Bauldia sp.]|nr:branched-chain amino acid ABC transporter permease [Bauldia sp.]
MSFEIVSSGFQHRQRTGTPLSQALKTGIVFGVLSLYLALVGVYLTFDKSWVVVNVLSMGRTLLFVVPLLAGVQFARLNRSQSRAVQLGGTLLVGLIVGGFTACLLPVILFGNLRVMFVALSSPLAKMLALGLTPVLGAAVLVAGSAAAALFGALLTVMSPTVRRPITVGLAALAVVALLQEVLQLILRGGGAAFSFITRGLFQYGGLTVRGAIIVFVAAALVSIVVARLRAPFKARFAELPPGAARFLRQAGIVILLAAIIFFPLIGGSFVAQVFLLVGLYALMGMGLNVEVGLAGLLDLGFVAYFAIGAYTIALLTADSPHALASMSFWAALPIAVLVSVAFGFLFGIPVLGIRGDYLAVATLGIGEIVRVLVLSDVAQPLLGGAQGILNIPSPAIGSFELATPTSLYFLTVCCLALATYFAFRVQDSRLGRTWMAMRDDEDVAQALGINLVKTKLLAYSIGAAFAGVAGAIFAVMLKSIFPHSFQLLISINILALIIVGGLGSLGGVIVGALVLIGLPELLREFGEYRFLLYGAVIVAMMRLKPEGLWPARIRRRETADA